jgi:hypothetical protein
LASDVRPRAWRAQPAGRSASAYVPRPSAKGNASMTRNSPKRRTPEQIRAGNLRLGLIMLAIAAVFFVSAIVKQVYFGAP